ncbi:hypothetical protein AB0G85_13035 [Streptomyces sioyaensis]|uniref:hypothetical protein n=1 Tax=Streptomyces sioyaensis TaxID=67364 RepID=UPI00340FDD78
MRKYASKLAAYLRDSVRQRHWPRGEEHLAPMRTLRHCCWSFESTTTDRPPTGRSASHR